MSTHARLFDHRGQPVVLGRQIGRKGGEGCAFEATSHPGYVAKLYHAVPPRDQVEKLDHLCRLAAAHPDLLSFAAWPVSPVNDGRAVRGFLMPLVEGKEIHQLFGPRERHLEFPTAGWDFLVHVARKSAAAFDSLHQIGAVVGDVNEGNILVADNGTVRLIDCDSFQVSDGSRSWTCDVGITLWTAPELQGQNFRGLARTANHDLFGLALLIFKTLFMGRHPFAGIPLQNVTDFVLEKAIAGYQFAFSAQAAALGVKPPPHSLSLSVLPPACSQLFEQAFLRGSQGARPTAAQWVHALDALKKELKKCPREPAAHQFHQSVPTCPWCTIASAGGPTFFIGGTILGAASLQDIRRLWQQILAVEKVTIEVRRLEDYILALPRAGAPLPQGIAHLRPTFVAGCVLFVMAIVLMIGGPDFLGISCALFGIGLALGGVRAPVLEGERVRREGNRLAADAEMKRLLGSLHELAARYETAFQQRQAALHATYERITRLGAERESAIQNAEARKRERQLRDFLDRQFIRDAGIHGIGPSQIATLKAYGIETAQDIGTVLQVPGIRENHAARLLNWKRLCNARFRYDPLRPLPPEEVQQIDARLHRMRHQLYAELQRAPGILASLNKNAQEEAQRCRQDLAAQGRRLAQAIADALVLQNHYRTRRPHAPLKAFRKPVYLAACFTLFLAWLDTNEPVRKYEGQRKTAAPPSTRISASDPLKKNPYLAYPSDEPPHLAYELSPATLKKQADDLKLPPELEKLSADINRVLTPSESYPPLRPVPRGPETEAAQRRAKALYPDLGVAGSAMNAQFLFRVRRYQREEPRIFDNPEWPTIIATECQKALHPPPSQGQVKQAR